MMLGTYSITSISSSLSAWNPAHVSLAVPLPGQEFTTRDCGQSLGYDDDNSILIRLTLMGIPILNNEKRRIIAFSQHPETNRKPRYPHEHGKESDNSQVWNGTLETTNFQVTVPLTLFNQ